MYSFIYDAIWQITFSGAKIYAISFFFFFMCIKDIAMKNIVQEKSKKGAVPLVPDVPAPKIAGDIEDGEMNSKATLEQYLYSIIYMPHSLRIVCLTNLFCWMAHVCYSLYFTDFVGEAVYGGDPKVNDSLNHILPKSKQKNVKLVCQNSFSSYTAPFTLLKFFLFFISHRYSKNTTCYLDFQTFFYV